MKGPAFERLKPEHAQRARIAVRGCRNCLYLDPDTQQCHHDSPREGQFQPIPAKGWCGRWRDARLTRIGWDSALSGVELEQLDEQGELLSQNPAALIASMGKGE